jgi:O-antigen/teichoic acid export membrane protein
MSSPAPSPTTANPPPSLGVSARASILWGGGFTLLRDVAQFGVMLILVRLLTPADYGTAMLVQAIVGVFSMISYGTFSLHTLQHRNPDEIDWQAHFNMAAVLNIAIATLVLALAFGLSFVDHYREVAPPLAALSVVFLIEIAGTLRHRMLEVEHNWKRFRLMLIFGTFLGLSTGLAVGLMGGGVWALIVQPPLLGLPAAIDLLVVQRFRPKWAWTWMLWRDTFRFGVDRVGAGLAGRGRLLNENILLSGLYDLATLGVFSRGIGLVMLIAGRVGPLATMSLYPVITRSEAGSLRFQRLAELLLRGVVWITVPAAAFLGIAAHDTVSLLYGLQWGAVVPLVPLAACAVGLGGIIAALSSLLVANNDSRTALSLDVGAAVSGIAVAVALIPFGIWTYLAGLSLHALLITIAATVLLVRRNAMRGAGVASAFIPAIVATFAGTVAVVAWRAVSVGSDWLFLRLLTDLTVFAMANVLVLRLVFSRSLGELLDVVPGGAWMRLSLRLASQ